MHTMYKLSTTNNVGMWMLFGFIFLYWLLLLLTSPNRSQVGIPALLLFAAALFVVPVIGTFFVYVTIDEEELTVPKAAFLRRSIPVKDMRALHYRPHGLGFLKGIVVEYLDRDGVVRKALLPSLSTFGTVKTSQMVTRLTQINSSIKIDPKILEIIGKTK